MSMRGYAAELERIRLAAGGLLRPADVVAAARDPKSPLHSHFEWDDGAAAEAYRLWQARQLIRAVVTIMPNQRGDLVQVRAYVSLPSDRGGGGYRATVDVVDDERSLEEALAMLRADVERLRVKYSAWAGLRPMLDRLVAETRRPRAAE